MARKEASTSMPGRGFRLQYLLLFLTATSAATAPPSTLRTAADRAGILIGTAVRPSLLSEAAYSATLSREFNMVEAEDAMKWQALHPNIDSFDFREGDEIVGYAQAHDMKVRGHCLVWDHNNPAWLRSGQFSPEQLHRLLQEHISTVMKHYAGQVFAWDVVNEALDENGRFKDSLWHNQPGIGPSAKKMSYVEQAFRWAHDADPHALLFYNENGGEGSGRKSDAIYAMLKDFRHRGVPVDGVGLQMHVELHPQSEKNLDAGAIAANIKHLADLGLQVHITELDVSLQVDANGQPTPSDLERQAQTYAEIVRACLQNAGCTAIQTWGFTDKYSWIGSHSHGARGAALPFDRGYKPKAAYDTLLQVISARHSN
jgi:endo-1,4-beta-xylanase